MNVSVSNIGYSSLRLLRSYIPLNIPQYSYTNVKQDINSCKAVNEAEKIVGYPTSFLNLRWLLNDEIANVALHLRKLIGTNHPLLRTARELLLNKQGPAWGLIVLLVSKAGGLSRQFSQSDCDITAGILHSQRVLAEITEMIRTSNLIHKSILNISNDDPEIEDLNFGNKLSLLTGDYLLSSSFKELAGLKCHEVNELISTCLRDLVEADFIEPRDSQNQPFPARPLGKIEQEIKVPNQFDENVLKISELLGNAEAEWTLRHLLDGASLLAKCCQATLMLADHPRSFQQLGYLFGRNMALAWQAHNDISIFKNSKAEPFSLICAPLMFHLEYDVSYYDKLFKDVENQRVDYKEIKEVVNNGPGIEKSNKMFQNLSGDALEALQQFAESDAKVALLNIIKSMKVDI